MKPWRSQPRSARFSGAAEWLARGAAIRPREGCQEPRLARRDTAFITAVTTALRQANDCGQAKLISARQPGMVKLRDLTPRSRHAGTEQGGAQVVRVDWKRG